MGLQARGFDPGGGSAAQRGRGLVGHRGMGANLLGTVGTATSAMANAAFTSLASTE
jgi:hypothetical protein